MKTEIITYIATIPFGLLLGYIGARIIVGKEKNR